MEPLKPTPLCRMKTDNPLAYEFVQTLIRSAIQTHPSVVRTMAGFGIAGEELHEAVEGLLERGLLRFRREGGPEFEQTRFYLQVYDIRDWAYRDVGVNPWGDE